ncbi:forkhead box protein P3 isoform X2 [Sander vitreus]
MPETCGESVRRGQAQPQRDRMKAQEEPRPNPPAQTGDAAGTQCVSSMADVRQKQQRASVLRQVPHTASIQQHVHPGKSAAVSMCKEEVDAGCLLQASSPPSRSDHFLPSRRAGPKQSSIEARLHHDGHLHSEHSRGDRSIAQWKVQQDIVQCMESQLILEKQKLLAMQLHLRLSEHKYTDLAASEWPYSLPVFLAQPQPQVTDGDRVQQWDIKHLQELSQHGYRAAGSAHLLPDLVPSIECYKYNNIRPPYTYAYLIRWAILESSDKQRTLNEIYNWFTTMFFYFRHNTATWKNAVRHNLSLHKCFVRVEGGKGAVWTVDESEYQRRKGPKYHRDCPVKWLTSYPHYCPEEA